MIKASEIKLFPPRNTRFSGETFYRWTLSSLPATARSGHLASRDSLWLLHDRTRIGSKKRKIEVVSRKTRLESKRNTPFWVAAENFREQRNICKVVLFFRMEYSKQKFEYHHLLKPIFDTSSRLSRSFFGKRNWFVKMVKTIPERNLPVLDFTYHSPETVNRPVFPCNGVRCFFTNKKF